MSTSNAKNVFSIINSITGSAAGNSAVNLNEGQDSPGRLTLEKASTRAFKFMGAVGRYPAIRALLEQVGYTKAVHDQGWELLKRVGHTPGETKTVVTIVNPVAAATDFIEQWQADNFSRIRAALHHLHPEQEDFVFGDGLAPAKGAAALGAIGVFLDRYDALKNAPDRKSTRKADHAALVMLSERGVTAALVAKLRGLQTVAIETNVVDIMGEDVIDAATTTAKRTQDLLALHTWLEDWLETARAVIVRRGDRIRIGIAQRKSAQKSPVIVPPTTPVVPVVPTAPTTPAAPAPELLAKRQKEDRGPDSRAA